VSTPGACLVPSGCPAWVCPGAASCERCLCLVDLFSCYFTIQRCRQIIEPLGEALDSIFDVNIVQQEVYRHRYRAINRDENV
jgi:hypothetical protein